MLPMLALALVLAQPPVAQPYRDDSVTSAALGRTMKYRVLLPADYGASATQYRALYLLHGLDGDYMDWSTRTELARIARGLPLVVIMADGENAWYTNAEGGGARFEDYVADDLIKDVERKYRVIRSRYGRAIAGLSMGGYGALKIALKRPGLFAAAGGFSSALAITDPAFADAFPAYRDQFVQIFGPAGSETRAVNDVLLLAAKVRPESAPVFYFDCGTSDGFIESNRAFAAALQKRGFAYEYHEVAGGHTWEYWNRRLEVFLPWLMKQLTRGATP
jgi:S-formylglutathione hydrolase FrmB